jgi:soluble lytic murein transglycosylase-like protein
MIAWLRPLLWLALFPLAVVADSSNDQGQALDAELLTAFVEAVSATEGFSDRFEAEVWLVDMNTRLAPFLQDEQQRIHILKAVHREASRTGLPPELVLSVIEVESRFDRYAISSATALGLMQIMPFWLDEIKTLPAYQQLVESGRLNDNLFDIDTNIWFGCTILKHYRDRERGKIWKALARYNGSVGKSWYPARVFRARDKHWFKQ